MLSCLKSISVLFGGISSYEELLLLDMLIVLDSSPGVVHLYLCYYQLEHFLNYFIAIIDQ